MIINLYGPRKTLAYLASTILDDANVESYEVHRDVENAGYAYITCNDDLTIATYEEIESAPGVTYEVEEAA